MADPPMLALLNLHREVEAHGSAACISTQIQEGMQMNTSFDLYFLSDHLFLISDVGGCPLSRSSRQHRTFSLIPPSNPTELPSTHPHAYFDPPPCTPTSARIVRFAPARALAAGTEAAQQGEKPN